MATCPYCQQSVRWWEPLVTRRGQRFSCPHCQRALRVDRLRYGVLTGTSVAVIASANLVPTEHPYLLVAVLVVLAVGACVLFGKVERADGGGDT